MQTVSQRRFADVAPLQDHVAEMQWKFLLCNIAIVAFDYRDGGRQTGMSWLMM